ncbi:ATP-NAD kinase [Ceratobasidium sp. AG-Ba]|nr:ATP-NAD kinase [Ceratobasidium sp. AG-Ba]QRW11363.1 ATP-NAD kinase [Ceratobasidium sp. AG-Ba]
MPPSAASITMKSPNDEAFATPPSTPSAFAQSQPQSSDRPHTTSAGSTPTPTTTARPSTSRRPSSLLLPNDNNTGWVEDVELVHDSEHAAKSPRHPLPPSVVAKQVLSPLAKFHAAQNPQGTNVTQALKSPCFVHSLLDKGASLSDWLRNTQQPRPPNTRMQPSPPSTQMSSASSSEPDYDEDDEEYAGSLTRQLAETAVGVREMSKQLGRARVRSKINNVLIITKARDNRLIKLTRELALMLMKKERDDGRGLVVYVDAQLRHSKRFDAAGLERDYPELFVPLPRRRSSSSTSVASTAGGGLSQSLRMSSISSAASSTDQLPIPEEGQLRYWTSEMCVRTPQLFDFVVTLGGDGTVLFASWLFQKIVPPILPFALGSLGFLTNFDFVDHRAVMDSAIDNGIRVNLRMRFSCTVYRAVAPDECKSRKAVKRAETGEILMRSLEKGGGWEALEAGYAGVGPSGTGCKDKEIMCLTTRPVETFEVLNDLVIDRGPSPYVSMLELFGDEHHMTTVQGDGLTVSTPTGSTAYSLSAGGSLVHPEIPAILITPICPHTLSFRPMLLPDSMELRVCVPYNSRSTAWASFDGRGRVELKPGDHIKVTASKFPFPTVCNDKQSTDWFHSISRTFKWNERERQKSFVMVEEDAPPKANGKPKSSPLAQSTTNEDEAEAEEEEEKYDIDDSSPEAATNATTTNAPTSTSPPPGTSGTGGGAGGASAVVAARAINRDGIVESHFTNKSGYDSPDRFRVPHPHPPKVHFRHIVDPADQGESSAGEGPAWGVENQKTPRPGDRDRGEVHPGAKEANQDGRPHSAGVQQHHHHSPHYPHHHHHHHHHHRDANKPNTAPPDRRAFAVWGQDESDSNTSDGEF